MISRSHSAPCTAKAMVKPKLMTASNGAGAATSFETRNTDPIAMNGPRVRLTMRLTKPRQVVTG